MLPAVTCRSIRPWCSASAGHEKHDVIGTTAAALFPPSLAARITAQDKAVIGDGLSIQGELELHLYPDGHQDWCLTWKEPLRAGDGRIIGLSGLSRDLKTLPGPQPDMKALSNALDHIRRNLDRPLLLADLARRAALSTYQLDQRIRSLFGLSAGQYIARARIELACNRLRETSTAISRVALDCGYADQAAFARQFKKYVGLRPRPIVMKPCARADQTQLAHGKTVPIMLLWQ